MARTSWGKGKALRDKADKDLTSPMVKSLNFILTTVETETGSNTHFQKAYYRKQIENRQKWKQGVLIRDFSIYPERDDSYLARVRWLWVGKEGSKILIKVSF